MNDLAHYVPCAHQNPYWKARITNAFWRKWDRWAFMNGWFDDYHFPGMETCFESVLEELNPLPLAGLLDPRLQIEVMSIEGDAYPTWACVVDRYEWIKPAVKIRSTTEILLLLFEPKIQRMRKEEVMQDLRHELGHVFLYLHDSEAIGDCDEADAEWQRTTRMEDFIG
jgi:hypothetical protein